MSNDWFFEKFSLIADAPSAVERMRELVLHLAVRGQLVPREYRDSSASEQLAELQPSVLELPYRFETPENWIWVPLDPLLSKMKNGYNGKPNKSVGRYKVTRIETIARGTIDTNRVGFADGLLAEVIEKHSIAKGDILFSHINSEPHLGKTAICTSNDPTLIHGVNLLLLRTNPQINPQYLNTVFKELRVAGYFISIAQRAINQSSINQKNLGKTPIPLPPLAEQKRIVAKVDELMGICDALESQQRERESRKSVLVRASLSRFAESPTPENLGYLFHKSYDIPPSELRKSILTLAVQGKLVPFDIASTKKTVDEHIDFQNGFAFKSQWFTTTGTRLCRNANVSHGFLDWKESVFVDEKMARDFQRFALCEGDIVLSLDRPLIATGLKVARVRQEDLPSLLLQRVARLTPKHDQLSRSYIFLWLNSTAFVDCIDPGRSNGVPHISTRQVQQLAFSIPPLAEQRRIVAKVDQLMALVDELERQQEASREKATKLLDAIVQEMTSGGRDIAATLES